MSADGNIIGLRLWAETGPTVQKVFDIQTERAIQFGELEKLAHSVGARCGAFQGSRCMGFIFEGKPMGKDWVLKGKGPEGMDIYTPTNTKLGKAIRKQMKKLYLPLFEEAIKVSAFAEMQGVQIGFHRDRVMLIIPIKEEALMMFQPPEHWHIWNGVEEMNFRNSTKQETLQ